LVLNGDGSFLYTPQAGFTGADSFTYQDNNGAALGNVATVNLRVVDTAPFSSTDGYGVHAGASLSVSGLPSVTQQTLGLNASSGTDGSANNAGSSNVAGLPGLLVNDGDPDGDVLQAILVSAPTHGSLILNSDGGFQYRPQAGFTGEDGFT